MTSRNIIYTVHRNGRSITRKGIYHGKIKHKKGWQGEQMALVTFHGNKRTSKVLHELLDFVQESKS